MKVIAIVGRKGGVGKTTLSAALTARICTHNRVVFVDLDPQGTGTLAMGVDPDGEALASLLQGDSQQLQIDEGHEGVMVLAGGPLLENITPRVSLSNILNYIDADYAIIDCPPGNVRLEKLALEAANIVLVACEPHRFAIAGASRVMEELSRLENEHLLKEDFKKALILGRFDSRRGLDKSALEVLPAAMNVDVFSIRQDASLSSALNAGRLPSQPGKSKEDIQKILNWIGVSNE